MLGVWRAAHGLPDPLSVTGEQVKEAIPGLADLSAVIVRPGPTSLATGVMALDGGATVNYEGASGPVDYDVNQNVKDQLSHFHVIDHETVQDLEQYNCIANSDASTLANAQAACPFVPAD
jgi:hypothetical protein